MSATISPLDPPARRHLMSVEVFRVLTALLIAFGHAQYDALVNAPKAGDAFQVFTLLPRGAGVDLFFVLTGFVAVLANRNTFACAGAPSAFLGRRLLRLAPMYWLATGCYVAFTLLLSRRAPEFDYSFSALVHNALFMPFDSYRDGFVRPIFSATWSLTYIVFFAAVFAASLVFSRARALVFITGFLTLGVLANLLSSAPLPLGLWFKPIVLEFVFGAVIAEFYLTGLRLPRLVSLAVGVIGLGILVSDPLHSHAQPALWIAPNGAERLLGWGAPTALIFGAAVLARASATAAAWPAWLGRPVMAAAQASFMLYLAHPFVIIALRKLLQIAGLMPYVGWWGFVGLCLVVSLAVSLVLHQEIEKPVAGWITTALAHYPSLARLGKASSK